jgi:hypothetical protein
VQGDIPEHRMCVTCKHFEVSKSPKKVAHHCSALNIMIGDVDLRLDCPVHEEADSLTQKKVWKIFAQNAT